MTGSEHRLGAGDLAARLDSLVRPEFRVEVFYAEAAPFIRHYCRVPSCGVPLTQTHAQLCSVDRARWSKAGRPDLGTWLTTVPARPTTTVPRRPSACLVNGCGRGRTAWGLCARHHRSWDRAGRPDGAEWAAGRAMERPARAIDHACVFFGCELRSDGPNHQLCTNHLRRWRHAGAPTDVAAWADQRHGVSRPRIRLGQLPAGLRLEVAYGLQRWADDRNEPLRPLVADSVVALLAATGLRTLLAVELDDWPGWWNALPGVRMHDKKARRFAEYVRLELERLRRSDPWQQEYARDRWDLRLLNIDSPDIRTFDFRPIAQPWLRALTKRWCRWRLRCGRSASTVRQDIGSVTALSEHLTRHDGPAVGPAVLTRIRLETWLTDLAEQYRERPGTRIIYISSVRMLLRDNRLHDWLPTLPLSAVLDQDTPPPPLRKRRTISDFVLRQLDSEDALAAFPSDYGRLLIRLGMACGLRLQDACQLPLDCVTRDPEGHPYLAWINRKSGDRRGYFPISEALAGHIAAQQTAARNRFADESPWLFPGITRNLTGRTPLRDEQARLQLRRWLDQLAVVDEHGEPVRITFHQFRHTLATNMLNRGVPLPVVQHLLGHSSPDTTAVYAHYNLATLRYHWDSAVAPTRGAEQPYSGPWPAGSWMPQQATGPRPEDRAYVILPQGRCGAPVQTTCEFANPCLSCRFFEAGPADAAQLQQQRERLADVLDGAKDDRVDATNQQTLIALERVIESIGAPRVSRSTTDFKQIAP